MAEEERLTHAEWIHKIKREECAANGHGPDMVIKTDGQAIRAFCECGEVNWLPQPRKI